ncbi:Hypothetical predicted protein [Cloeon dipterum]|uniref:Cystatin domain-containing protein n=1 Tax=Cloeon dipterum TaxID=197152 RepID=A0A8S1DRX3_9INSE|nr:Hypothetical predicted protein [Cloeon dipterum]
MSHCCALLLLLLPLLAMIVVVVSALPPVIRIGAIFTEDQKDSSTELAFKYAVYRINKEKTILPNTTLVYDIQYVPKDDSFRTSKKGTWQARVWIARSGPRWLAGWLAGMRLQAEFLDKECEISRLQTPWLEK